MKWMLFVLVFGSHPVETNLVFDTTRCLPKGRRDNAY